MADRYLEIPKASIRRIMKLNDEVTNVSAESIITTAKATELFIATIVEASRQVAIANNRKTIRVDDLLLVIEENQQSLEFLNTAFCQTNSTS